VNLEALKALAEAVEAGNITEWSPWLHMTDRTLCVLPWRFRPAVDAYNSSFDAALALHEAVMPGCGWDIWKTMDHHADGTSTVVYGVNIPGIDTVFGVNPARALLLAIIRAKIAQAEKGEG